MEFLSLSLLHMAYPNMLTPAEYIIYHTHNVSEPSLFSMISNIYSLTSAAHTAVGIMGRFCSLYEMLFITTEENKFDFQLWIIHLQRLILFSCKTNKEAACECFDYIMGATNTVNNQRDLWQSNQTTWCGKGWCRVTKCGLQWKLILSAVENIEGTQCCFGFKLQKAEMFD